MRKIYTKMIAIAVISVMVISCSTTKKGDYTSVIPGNATMVISFDLQSLWDKSGLGAEQNKEFVSYLQNSMISEFRTPNGVLEGIIKDPAQSGVDIKERIYVYANKDMDKSGFMVAKVSNYDNLLKSIESLSSQDVNVSVNKVGEATVATFVDGGKLAFNNSILLLQVGMKEVVADSLVAQLNGYGDNSIAVNPAFEKMVKSKNDISMFFAVDKMQELMLKNIPIAGVGNIEVYKNLYVICGANFEVGKMSFTGEYFTKDEATKKQLAEQLAMVGTIGKQELSNFSADLMAFLGMNFNGEKMIEYINKVNPNIFDSSQEAIMASDALKSINGDIGVGLQKIMPAPEALATVQVKNDALLKLIVYNQRNMGINLTKVSDSEYMMRMGGNILKIGIQDNKFYARLNTAESEKIEKTLAASEWGSTISSSSSYFLLNVESALRNVGDMAKMFIGSSRKNNQLFDLLAKVAYVETYANVENCTFVFNICTTDKQNNSLKILTDAIVSMQ